MTYIYETVMGTKKLVVEYCYSSVDKCIKVVEMKADGKFHRINWMSENGRNSLMSQLVEDYGEGGVDYANSDYDSEIDLDRDVPELNHLVSIGAV